MKNIKSLFSDNQNEMPKAIGVVLSNNKDYTNDELNDIYDKITDRYQVAAFDKNGEPLPIAKEWERIIDTFYDDTNR